MATDIPIIDFEKATSSPEQLAADLLAACTDWGTLHFGAPLTQATP
jgi:hypothetical protein